MPNLIFLFLAVFSIDDNPGRVGHIHGIRLFEVLVGKVMARLGDGAFLNILDSRLCAHGN